MMFLVEACAETRLPSTQPVIHQAAIHQPAIHQPAIRQPLIRQPAIRQPVILSGAKDQVLREALVST
jgi:hypothetical protein